MWISVHLNIFSVTKGVNVKECLTNFAKPSGLNKYLADLTHNRKGKLIDPINNRRTK